MMYEELSVVGKRIPLREGRGKVTGTTRFAPDYNMVGALWMKILRSPHPHAVIKKIDTTEAEALPEVRAVLTYKDVPQKEIECAISNWKGRVLENRVRFVGDEVAAVAAETEKGAEESLDLIQVEYEKLPAVFCIEEALKSDAPDVRGVGNNKVSSPPEPSNLKSHQEWGDLERGFVEADAVVECSVKTQSVYGGFFPPACIADWSEDQLTIIISHQSPYNIRTALCNAFDMPVNKVRIIAPLLAGSFGTLNSAHRFWHIAALLSKKTGRPVIYKMSLDEFGVYKRKESDIIHVKMGGKKDGTVTALDIDQLHDNGGYGWKSTTYGTMHDIFARSNVRYRAFGVNTNKFSSGCIRGVGNVPLGIAINQAIDMLAEKLEVDPLVIWKKNHHKAGDLRHCDGVPDVTLSSEAYDELIDRGAECIGWGKKWKGAGKPYEVRGSTRRGVGMAVTSNVSGRSRWGASAIIEVNQDGTANVAIGSTDLGTGCKTTFAQMCAEVLGLRVEDVYVTREVDTQTVPFMCRTAGSVSMHLGGSAIKVAAADAKRQILEMAYGSSCGADIFKRALDKVEELDMKDGFVYVKADPARRVAVKEVLGGAAAPRVIGRARRHDIPVSGPQAYAGAACFADVEVDTETGKVNVLKLVACHDSGRIVNPEICENQVYGGVIQSLGYGLMEEVVFDSKTGKALNPSLADYLVPTSLDTPPIEVIFANNMDPVGPLGAKGIGESTVNSPHGAIANAVYNAIGVRISELPITPDRVLNALGSLR